MIVPLPYAADMHTCPSCWKNGGPGHELHPVATMDAFGQARLTVAAAHRLVETREPWMAPVVDRAC